MYEVTSSWISTYTRHTSLAVHASTSSSSSFSSSSASAVFVAQDMDCHEDEEDVVGEILIIARYSVSECLNVM